MKKEEFLELCDMTFSGIIKFYPERVKDFVEYLSNYYTKGFLEAGYVIPGNIVIKESLYDYSYSLCLDINYDDETGYKLEDLTNMGKLYKVHDLENIVTIYLYKFKEYFISDQLHNILIELYNFCDKLNNLSSNKKENKIK